jgi:hypothetical protein
MDCKFHELINLDHIINSDPERMEPCLNQAEYVHCDGDIPVCQEHRCRCNRLMSGMVGKWARQFEVDSRKSR